MIHWFWIFKSSRIKEPASVPEFLLKIIRIGESFFLVISNPLGADSCLERIS
jgi:hypothetical protein